MDILAFDDYKIALRKITEGLRLQFGARYTLEKVAIACGIQKTYLSRVLNGKSHLTADQIFMACEFLRLSTFESEVLETLRDFQTSCNQKRRQQLKKKMTALRITGMKTESALKVSPAINSEKTWEYYSNFNLHLTHLLMTTPKYSENPSEICRALNFTDLELENNIRKLKNWGLIKQNGLKFEAKDFSQHLSEDSPVFKTFAIQQRLKTIEKLHRGKSDPDYFFSVLFSADKDMGAKLRKKILALLDETKGQIEKSNPEQVYQFNIDLFGWG